VTNPAGIPIAPDDEARSVNTRHAHTYSARNVKRCNRRGTGGESRLGRKKTQKQDRERNHGDSLKGTFHMRVTNFAIEQVAGHL
jgi:hypothetical protein